MRNEFFLFKNLSRITLEPFIELLEHKRSILNERDWSEFVNIVKTSVISNPQQFLGHELPGHDVVDRAIREIFEEYKSESMAVVAPEAG